MTRWLPICLVAALGLLISASIGQAGHEKLKCDECHATHRPETVGFETSEVWSTKNLDDGLQTFTLYSSPSFDALGTDISQPDGTSKLCLGCHDGSYMGIAGRLRFGESDLSRTHPVSFTYDSSLAARVSQNRLNDPNTTASGLGDTIRKDLLDDRSKLQCTSCHDMHGKQALPKMLRFKFGQGSNDPLCRVCHNM
mgnify:CR=1 FL=1